MFLSQIPFIEDNLLSLLLFCPLIGCLLLLLPIFGGQEQKHADRARLLSLLVSLITFLLSVHMLTRFDAGASGYQCVERHSWIPSFGITYFLGVDGISLFLVLLTTFMVPLVILASYSITRRVRGYLASMLFLETAMIGTFLALDLFLFYLFWELMLAPMYFIIGIWGGERRIYASIKFVLYTVAGSLLMLLAIVFVVWRYYDQTGVVTFALDRLMGGGLLFSDEVWLFVLFALAFGIKVPIFPVHTWLPDAHVEAPTGGSVILAGVLLKMGIYGFLRFAFPLFPRAAEHFAPLLGILAVIGIIYGALLAWAQIDIKKLIAYSSISHLGFCVLGLAALNAVSTSGAVFQMLSHGITTGALFLLVGVLYHRRHTRLIADYGGLAARVPVFAFLFLVFTLGSIALPLTCGFVGEFLILSGSFRSLPLLTTIAVLGVVLGAIYMLTLYMKTMYGELDQNKNGALQDISRIEFAALFPLLIALFVMGIYPRPFLSRIENSVSAYVENIEVRRDLLKRFEAGEKVEGESTEIREEPPLLRTRYDSGPAAAPVVLEKVWQNSTGEEV